MTAPTPPNVVNRRTARARPGDVYIGRPSRWGNPFVIGRDGTRDQVIELYRRRLWTDLHEGRTSRSDLAALAGKRLVLLVRPGPVPRGRPGHGRNLGRRWGRARRGRLASRLDPHPERVQ